MKRVTRLLTGVELWPEILRATKRSRSTKAAISYFTSADYIDLKRGDFLIVDASDNAIGSGETSATALKMLHQNGVELRTCAFLHAKLIVCRNLAFVGSANASASSADRLIEAVLMTYEMSAVAGATAFIEQLKLQSEKIDSVFLDRIAHIPVRRRPRSFVGKRKAIEISGQRIWLVNATEYDESKYADEEDAVEEATDAILESRPEIEDVSWTRWAGTSRFRTQVRAGDIMLVITKKESGRIVVEPPSAIVWRQDVENWTRVYQSAYLTGDLRPVAWTPFLKLWKQMLLPKEPVRNTMRELESKELDALMSVWPKKV